MTEDQLDRLKQKQDAGSDLESGHADLQEPKELHTANREDDENPAGYDNRSEGEATSLWATGCRGQDAEDGSGLQRPDGDQKHHDRRSRKFEGAPHFYVRPAAFSRPCGLREAPSPHERAPGYSVALGNCSLPVIALRLLYRAPPTR